MLKLLYGLIVSVALLSFTGPASAWPDDTESQQLLVAMVKKLMGVGS